MCWIFLQNWLTALALVDGSTFSPLSANFTKWSNTLKQVVGNLPTNCLSVFDHLVKLTLKGLSQFYHKKIFLLKNE